MVGNQKTLYLLTLIGLMTIGGTGISILMKIIPAVSIQENKFRHPYFCGIWFFIGQIFCMIFHGYNEYKMNQRYGDYKIFSPAINRAMNEGKGVYASRFHMIPPAFADSLRSVLFFLGMIHLPGSVVNMLSSMLVISTAGMNYALFGKKLKNKQILALILILTGVAVVNFAVISKSKDGDSNDYDISDLVLGISMMILSVMIQSVQLVAEERLLRKYYITPMRMIGWEGIWGTLFFSIFLLVAQHVKGDGDLGINGVLEDSIQAMKQALDSTFVIISLLGFSISGFLMNYLGVIVTKHATSAHRAAAFQIKVVLIWFFFLFYDKYGTGEKFIWTQLIGFSILVSGVLVFI